MVTWLGQEGDRKADIFTYNLENGTETQVSTSGYAAFFPSISGSKIAWTDARSSNGNTSSDLAMYGRGPGSDIYLQDLKTKTETRITTTGEWKVWQSPVICGDHMVYKWNLSAGAPVYVMDLSSFTNSRPERVPGSTPRFLAKAS
jgi:beta propeller repeat protein